MSQFEFESFGKIARLKSDQTITEKLDGTNAQVSIFEMSNHEAHDECNQDPYCIDVLYGDTESDPALVMYAGSRKRWIATNGHINDSDGVAVKGTDNFGFARWVYDNSEELFKMGEGRHFGEWMGLGIQRGYGLTEKRFALFNVLRWGVHNPNTPKCCHVVPDLTELCGGDPDVAMEMLMRDGSMVEKFNKPEGICVYHHASRTYYKQTFDHDKGKWTV